MCDGIIAGREGEVADESSSGTLFASNQFEGTDIGVLKGAE